MSGAGLAAGFGADVAAHGGGGGGGTAQGGGGGGTPFGVATAGVPWSRKLLIRGFCTTKSFLHFEMLNIFS